MKLPARLLPIAAAIVAGAAVGSAAHGGGRHPAAVTATVLVPANDSAAGKRLQQSLATLSARGLGDLRIGRIAVVQLPRECFEGDSPPCRDLQARTRPAAGEVEIFAYDPGWRAADHKVTCLGRDRKRKTTVALNLRDAVHWNRQIADRELARLASCLRSALDTGRPAPKDVAAASRRRAAALVEVHSNAWRECLLAQTAIAARRRPIVLAPSPRERCVAQENRLREAWASLPESERADADADSFVERLRKELQPRLDDVFQRNNYE